MKTFRKFVLLADIDNARLTYEELENIIKRVESLGAINYIKLYGLNDKRLKEFESVIAGRCCDTAPIIRSKGKSRKNVQDTRIIIDAMKIADSGVADSFAIIAGNGDYGYLLSALKSMGKFIVGRFDEDVNINFCDVYLVDFDTVGAFEGNKE